MRNVFSLTVMQQCSVNIYFELNTAGLLLSQIDQLENAHTLLPVRFAGPHRKKLL